MIVDTSGSGYRAHATTEHVVTLTTFAGVRAGGRVAVDASPGVNLRMVGLGAMFLGLQGEEATDPVPVTAA